MKMIKNEFKFIFKSKIMLISLFAIMFIPFLYSIFFLKSVWNPYGSTGNLPVAVVNEDKPVKYQGQVMHAGDDMVQKLKKDNQLGWNFVSASEAKQGIKDKKYYTVITLPKNFSKNASTVLNKNPKKMQIQYKTNDSLNYLAEVISEMGAKELNTQIREAVTTAYSKVMFDQVKQAGQGFSDAAKGAKQLSDGSSTLNSGLNVYTNGVDKVNDGVLTMQTSVVPLSDGVIKLANGANQLNDGVGAYTNGVDQVNNGVLTMQGSVVPLSDGVIKLANGANQLNDGVGVYTNGVASLNGGLQNLTSNNDKLSDGTKVLTDGVNALQTGSSQIDAGLKQIQTELNSNPSFSSDNNYNNAVNGYKSIQTQITNIQSQLKNLDAVLKPIVDQVAAQDYASKAQEIIDAEKDAGVKFSTGQEAIIKMALTVKLKNAAVDEANQIVDGVKTTVNGKISDEQFKQLQTATQGSIDMLGSLRKIQIGLNGSGTKENPGLVTGMDQLNSGINQLQSGSKEISEKLGLYTNGVASAANGTSQLVAQNGALNSGSQQLAAGTNSLNSNIPALSSGVNQLANGTSQLAAKSGALNSGSQQLAAGTNSLNSNIPALSSGVNQLADGTNQLAKNSPQLTNGSSQLSDGSKTLSDALGDGSKKVNSIKLTDKTAKQFAAPSKLKHSNYSKVPNYGHALAPYVLSLALYVGAVVFNFAYPVRKISTTGQSATAWFLSKISVGAVVAVAMAIIEPALMMVAGLQIIHPVQFFAVSITFSLTSMAIVMFLSVVFDNPGRFVAMILLMLQLGGSGGTFPMELTNKFYNFIHPFVPMTYSNLGFRQSISSGLGNAQVAQSILMLVLFMIVNLGLLWLGMNYLQSHGNKGESVLDDNQKLQELEE